MALHHSLKDLAEIHNTEDDGIPPAECDCCGKRRPLSRCWPYGIETFACDQCRGISEGE